MHAHADRAHRRKHVLFARAQLAAEHGLDVEAVLAEAESIAIGIARDR
jgi:hypothetical protein